MAVKVNEESYGLFEGKPNNKKRHTMVVEYILDSVPGFGYQPEDIVNEVARFPYVTKVAYNPKDELEKPVEELSKELETKPHVVPSYTIQVVELLHNDDTPTVYVSIAGTEDAGENLTELQEWEADGELGRVSYTNIPVFFG